MSRKRFRPHVLIVDDDPSSREALTEWVEARGFQVRSARTLANARLELKEQMPDLVLLDLQLPDGSGVDLLSELDEAQDTDVVMVTGHASVDSAVEAMRGGAIDYLTKPVDPRRLGLVLRNLERSVQLRRQVSDLRGELRRLGHFGSMVGASPQMQEVYELLERVAPTDAAVFVIGETGTGKELVARTVHDLSRRADGPWIPINCGAVAPNLIESELFGHEKGSFTGADRMRKGVFERASGGTLFLDEITEMPLELQVKLLRVLETGQVTRIGGEKGITTDVRIVAATNRDPHEAVEAGKLREDLLYRLMVFPVQLPTLGERQGDVARLAVHFVEVHNAETGESKELGDSALAMLQAHPWPGNVRELENAIRHAWILADDRIEASHLPFGDEAVSGRSPIEGSVPEAREGGGAGAVRVPVGSTVKEAERRLILATLEACDGNKREAAKTLGISLKTLYNRLNVYEASRKQGD